VKITILIADDDPIFRELIRDMLKKELYNVLEVDNGEKALDMFYDNKDIDLVILDVMMPELTGWEVLDEIRMQSDIPVIMLTALGDEQSELQGLHAGADDYIAKPFSYPIFMARIKALLRKIEKEKTATLQCGVITLNKLEHKVYVLDKEVVLINKEYQLLEYFMNNIGLTLTRDMLINNIWGFDYDGDSRTLDTNIKTLRAKLKDAGKYIRTIRGIGYRFEMLI
jgi:two-component system, OmpR family, response regulator ResD